MVSTLQIKKGLKCGNVTYIIALVENKADQSIEVPHSVTHIQKEVKDMMPSKFPKELPPRCHIDHKIELPPRTKLPIDQVSYRMLPSKLLELRK